MMCAAEPSLWNTLNACTLDQAGSCGFDSSFTCSGDGLLFKEAVEAMLACRQQCSCDEISDFYATTLNVLGLADMQEYEACLKELMMANSTMKW